LKDEGGGNSDASQLTRQTVPGIRSRHRERTPSVEPSLLQARRSETIIYRTVSESRLSAAVASGNYLRRTSSTVTQHTQRSRDAVWVYAI